MLVKPAIRRDGSAVLPATLIEPLRVCALGRLPANVALMQIILMAEEARCVDRAIDAAAQEMRGREEMRLAVVARLWRENRAAFATLREVASLFDHHRPAADGPSDEQIAVCAAAFDKAAERAPDAGSALYALGNPDLLEAATAEIVARMQDWRLFSPSSAVLEIGCGAGRFLASLAPLVREVIGIDISDKMIAAARQRCADLGNVQLLRTGGQDLSCCASSSIDLLYAVDSFPYILQFGRTVLCRHFRDAARILKPGGFFLILNYSYGRDPADDIFDLCGLGGGCGLALIRKATGDFCLWDGRTYLLKRDSG